MTDGMREEGAWGCSLSEASHIMTRLGYVLVQLDYSDALFVMTAHASVIQVSFRASACHVLACLRVRTCVSQVSRHVPACHFLVYMSVRTCVV